MLKKILNYGNCSSYRNVEVKRVSTSTLHTKMARLALKVGLSGLGYDPYKQDVLHGSRKLPSCSLLMLPPCNACPQLVGKRVHCNLREPSENLGVFGMLFLRPTPWCGMKIR